MPEEVHCECGRVFEVDWKRALGLVKCPSCGRPVQAPVGAGKERGALGWDVDELTLETEETPAAPRAKKAGGSVYEPETVREKPKKTAEVAVPQPTAEEEEAKFADIVGVIRNCLFSPGAISKLDLAKSKILTQLAVAFLVLNIVPSIFDGVRISRGFLDFAKNVQVVFVFRVAAIAGFTGFLKLVMMEHGRREASTMEVAGGLLLCHILAILLFTPLAFLNVIIAVLAGGLVKALTIISMLAFGVTAFFYQARMLKELFGPGCFGVVVINALGVCLVQLWGTLLLSWGH